MVKSKNIIAGLGVVAGLGMALLPLASYATDSNTVEHTVRGVVGDIISITVATNSEATLKDNSKISRVALEPGKINAELVHTVTVNTNARGGYDLKMNAKDGKTALRYITAYDETNDDVAKTYSESITIPSVTGNGAALADKTASDTTAGAWGYKIKASTDDDYSGNFLPIPAEATSIKNFPATSAASKTGSWTDTYNVNFGIVPANDQLSGAYEATLVYQAVTNAL